MIEKTVAILLSTYNGEKFLEKQLASLFSQTYWEHCTLYVRDDGSTDGTSEILNRYVDNKKVFVEYGNNLGCEKSFEWLMRTIPNYDYYCFCDQDDFWYANKIEESVKELEKNDPNVPLLYYSDYETMDAEENTLEPHHVASKIYPTNFNIMTLCHTLGCTTTFNHTLRLKWCRLKIDKYVFHDYTASLIALYLGKLVYKNQPMAKYRIHGKNLSKPVVGLKGLLGEAFSISFIKSYITVQRTCWNAFYTEFSLEMDEEQRNIFDIFLNKNIINQIKKVFYPEKYRKEFFNDMYFRLLAFLWII